MRSPAPPGQSPSRSRRLTIAVAVAAAAAALTGLGYGIAMLDGSEQWVPQRLTATEKQRIESELHAALAARRRLDWRAFRSHGDNALHVAQRRGQRRLVEAIRGSAGLGCFAAATEFRITRALRILDALPVART